MNQNLSKQFSFIRLLNITAISASVLLSTYLSAKPLIPDEQNAANNFSQAIKDKFYLFTDSLDNTLIWFVSKNGGIEARGGAPSLSISKHTWSSGLFTGQSYLKINGILSPLAKAKDMQLLKSEAHQLGFSLLPAYAKKTRTIYKIGNIEIDNHGTANVVCNSSTEPDCQMRDRFGNYIDASIYYSLKAFSPKDGASTSQSLPFTATTLPSIDNLFSSALAHTKNWNQLFTASTQWTIEVLHQGSAETITVETTMEIECVNGSITLPLWFLNTNEKCREYMELWGN
ncbi:hypothetical protein [Spartinivicinus ruber]|uniref:hypothetical protein n=1 Tax=Spartinivicinus ruber TaxID=2683272 RepID=UPI0013D83E80|nr:hypothetical protein [Spartinivicinus ruber]